MGDKKNNLDSMIAEEVAQGDAPKRHGDPEGLVNPPTNVYFPGEAPTAKPASPPEPESTPSTNELEGMYVYGGNDVGSESVALAADEPSEASTADATPDEPASDSSDDDDTPPQWKPPPKPPEPALDALPPPPLEDLPPTEAELRASMSLPMRLGRLVGFKTERASQEERDRRKYYRVPSVIPVDFQLRSKTGGALNAEVRTALTQDISGKGLRLQINNLPPILVEELGVEDKSDLEMRLDIRMKKRTLRISGDVMWFKTPKNGGSFEVGIQFVDVSPTDTTAIIGFARRAVIRAIIARYSIALMVLAIAGGALVYYVQDAQHRAELARAASELSETDKQYRKISSEFETQAGQIQALSAKMKTLIAEAEALAGEPVQNAVDDSAEDTEGASDAETDASIQDMLSSMEELRTITSKLKTKIDSFSKRVEEQKRNPKKRKKRRKKRRRRKR